MYINYGNKKNYNFWRVWKDGSKEEVDRIDLKLGDIVSIVGPTGCGKTTLINDIELFANREYSFRRQILINDEPIAR